MNTCFLFFSNIRLPETVPVPVCNLYEHSITGNAITNTKTNVELKDTHTHTRGASACLNISMHMKCAWKMSFLCVYNSRVIQLREKQFGVLTVSRTRISQQRCGWLFVHHICASFTRASSSYLTPSAWQIKGNHSFRSPISYFRSLKSYTHS